MRISSRDAGCRYVPAVGTLPDSHSGFGALLRKHGVLLPSPSTLGTLIELGWLKPVLRVALPRQAFEAWRDFPLLSMDGIEECPPEHQWALELFGSARTSPGPAVDPRWWMHFLDDPDEPLNQAARAHALDPGSPLPPIFHHARHNQEVRPWIDYFAYWQVMLIADLLDAASVTTWVLDRGDDAVALPRLVRENVTFRVERVLKRWQTIQPAFERLSWVRTVLGASMIPDRDWGSVERALDTVADRLGITAALVKADIRDALLTLWAQQTERPNSPGRWPTPLLELLRQDIEYALVLYERLSRTRVNFLDPYWHYTATAQAWARLIDALPREEELARENFPRMSHVYLSRVTDIPTIASLSEADLSAVLTRNWERSRALRRFVLAFHRLHRELQGVKLMANKSIIAASERIEQFNLVMLHAERVLSAEYRERRKEAKYPEIRKLAKDTLTDLLSRWGLGSTASGAQAQAQSLLEKRAMLHNMDSQDGLPLVAPGEVSTGSATVDEFVRALVNMVIIRNYAAHHDIFDFDLVYPDASGTAPHPGHTALTAVLVAVMAVLLTRRGEREMGTTVAAPKP